jgi:hypothetical protein
MRLGGAVGRRVAEVSLTVKQRLSGLLIGVGLQLSWTSFGYELRTHQVLTEFAFDRSVISSGDLFSQIDLEEAVTTKLFPGATGIPRLAKELIRDGAEFEDDWPRPINHFFNPLTGEGLGLGYPAPDWALSDNEDNTALLQSYSFRDARRAYYDALTRPAVSDRDIALGKVFETLGHVTHLIQDMAQPQHVRSDAHPTGLSGTYSRYEKITEDLVRDNPSAILFTGYPNVYEKNSTRSLTSPRAFWQTGAVGITGVQQGKGLAEFTNRNFVSAGTNFGGTINHLVAYSGVRGTFPLPDPGLARVSAPIDASSLDPALPSGEFMLFISTPVTETLFSEYQGATNLRASTFSVFDQDLVQKGSTMIFALNKFNFAAAREFLIPRAVAYSAGMIDYFFRGDIDLIPDSTQIGRYVIANYDIEPMKGTFAFFYDALDGTRKPLVGAKWDGLSIAGFNLASNKPGLSQSIRIDSPADAKQAGKYMLVFLGDMGEEKRGDGSPTGGFAFGAVVGKLVTAVPLEALYIAGIDNGGRVISLRVDESGTHLINGPDANGVVRQSQEFDPVRGLVAPNVLNKRPYYWKQARFLEGSAAIQYRIHAVNTPGGAFVRDPVTQAMRSFSGYWIASSTDPAIGWFAFSASAGTPNSGALLYTRTYVDAEGKTQTSTGSVPLPPLPNYDPNAPSTGYDAFAFNKNLVVSEDGLTIYGFKTSTRTYSPPLPWNQSTAFPQTLTTTEYGISLHVVLAATPTVTAQIDETMNSVQVADEHGAYDASLQPTCIPPLYNPPDVPSPMIRSEHTVVDTSSSFVSSGQHPGKERKWVGIFAGALTSFMIERSALNTAHDETHDEHMISGYTGWTSAGACNNADSWTYSRHDGVDYTANTTYHLRDGDVQSTQHGYRITDEYYDPSPYARTYSCVNGVLGRTCQVTTNGSDLVSSDTGDQVDNHLEDLVFVLRPDTAGVVFAVDPLTAGRRLRFRGVDITGKDFVGDASPLGEIFFATTDFSTVFHEPLNGRMPQFVRPANMVKILAALWL